MLKRLFIHEKTVEILLKILEAEENGKKIYPMIIAREVGSPYSYVSKILSEFEKFAIVESEFEGRTKVLRLTKDGKRIAELLRDLINSLNSDLISRWKVEKLKEIFERSQKNFRSLAGILAEIEYLKNSKDEKVLKDVKELEELIRSVLDEKIG